MLGGVNLLEEPPGDRVLAATRAATDQVPKAQVAVIIAEIEAGILILVSDLEDVIRILHSVHTGLFHLVWVEVALECARLAIVTSTSTADMVESVTLLCPLEPAFIAGGGNGCSAEECDQDGRSDLHVVWWCSKRIDGGQ